MHWLVLDVICFPFKMKMFLNQDLNRNYHSYSTLRVICVKSANWENTLSCLMPRIITQDTLNFPVRRLGVCNLSPLMTCGELGTSVIAGSYEMQKVCSLFNN